MENINRCPHCGRDLSNSPVKESNFYGAGIWGNKFYCPCGWVVTIRPVSEARRAETTHELNSCLLGLKKE